MTHLHGQSSLANSTIAQDRHLEQHPRIDLSVISSWPKRDQLMNLTYHDGLLSFPFGPPYSR